MTFFLFFNLRMNVCRYVKPCVKHVQKKLPKVRDEFRIFVANNGCREPKIGQDLCEEMFR